MCNKSIYVIDMLLNQGKGWKPREKGTSHSEQVSLDNVKCHQVRYIR